TRTVVDADDSVDLTGETDPQLARCDATHTGLERGADLRARGGIDEYVGLIGGGDDGTGARPRCHLRRAELRRHPATPPVRSGHTGADGQEWILDEHLGDQLRARVVAGVGGEQAGGVGEQYQQI